MKESASRLAILNWASLAALLMLAAAFLCAWSELRGMTTTSLWNDELFSIAHYSAKGPLFTMTHYIQPNNHIFFNLLNSITPMTNRFAPVEARFWSFVFVALGLLTIVVSQALAGQLFQGSFQAFLFLANLSHLDLMLQARGYGILAFAAIICTFLTWEFFREPSLIPLVGIAVAVWLGTWTVPTFGFFGAALFFLLIIYTRDWRWIVSACASVIAIGLVYWPVHAAVLRSSHTYGAEWGKDFANWDAIGDVFSTYLLFGTSRWLAFLVVALTAITFFLRPIRSPAEKASFCLGLAVLLTFAACLKMETPLPRTVAFTVVPFAFILTTLVDRLLRFSTFAWIRPTIMLGIVIAATAFVVHVRQTFHFIPIEAWMETARKVEERFPKGTEIVAQFRPEWLKVYLSTDYVLTGQVDPAKFMSGKQIVVDSSITPKSRFPVSQLPPGYSVISVRQHRGKKQKIYFWPAG